MRGTPVVSQRYPIPLTLVPGWMDHFANKYIICGKLVENDAV